MRDTKMKVMRCRIYEVRPKLCKDYPLIDHWTPAECTFYFEGTERKGVCACNVGACCAVPRREGEPTGEAMPFEAGGLPCKHLVEVEESEKTASEETTIAEDNFHEYLESAVG